MSLCFGNEYLTFACDFLFFSFFSFFNYMSFFFYQLLNVINNSNLFSTYHMYQVSAQMLQIKYRFAVLITIDLGRIYCVNYKLT